MEKEEEEEIQFNNNAESPPSKAFHSEPGEEALSTISAAQAKATHESSSTGSPLDDFEYVSEDKQEDNLDAGGEDYELDELEAEILKELEDD